MKPVWQVCFLLLESNVKELNLNEEFIKTKPRLMKDEKVCTTQMIGFKKSYDKKWSI